MARRNQFVEQELRYRRLVHEMVPKIYAAFAISLHRNYGFGYKRIERILQDTHYYWNNQPHEIVQMCSDEVGINMVSAMTAKELDIKGDSKI